MYTTEQCGALLRAAAQLAEETGVDWPLLVSFALCTGMRRGEIVNVVWANVDFEPRTVEVAPKQETRHTWAWFVKDAERRTLPLTDELVAALVERQANQPEGQPYVFIPQLRYERIQHRRAKGTWTVSDGRCPLNNFTDRWKRLLRYAGLGRGTFHDLRRTALTNWLMSGMSEYDVMHLAGHSHFQTTHTFYLAVRADLVDRDGSRSSARICRPLGTRPRFGSK